MSKTTFRDDLERIHLQWFADPDEEVDEEPVDEEEVPENQPDRAWSVLDTEVEEFDDTAEPDEPGEGGPSLEDIQAKIDAYEQKASGAGQNEALAGALGQLSDAIKDLKGSGASQAQQDQAAKVAEKSYRELLKEAENSYYDSPLETLDRLVDAKVKEMVGPGLRQVAQIAQQTRRNFGEFRAKSDPTSERVLTNYRDEVDGEVDRNGGDVEAAVQTVAGKHMTDLIQMGIEDAMKVQTEEKPATKARNQNPKKATGRRPAPQSNTVQVPASLAPTLREEAVLRGVSYADYARYIKRTNPERLKGGR